MEEKELVPGSYFEDRRIAPRWRHGVPPQAGVWMLDGGWHCAALGSAAEAQLREAGALLVATLRFDGGVGDRPVRGSHAFDPYPDPRPAFRRQVGSVRN